jgi:hypothetical protein
MNRFQEINSASLYSLADRYDNPIPTRFISPIDCLKIPALYICVLLKRLVFRHNQREYTPFTGVRDRDEVQSLEKQPKLSLCRSLIESELIETGKGRILWCEYILLNTIG